MTTTNILNNSFPLPADAGGTGWASPTVHTIPVCEGGGQFNLMTLADGQVVGGVTGADPEAKNLAGGNNIDILFSPGNIAIGVTSGWQSSITSPPGDYTTTNSDFFIGANTSTVAVTITLVASPGVGQTQIIKDINGNSAAHNITIQGNGNLIDGAASTVINSAYGKINLIYDGTHWNSV